MLISKYKVWADRFPDRNYESFGGLKTFIGESDSSGIIDFSCLGCGQPHPAHTAAKIAEVKDLALIFW